MLDSKPLCFFSLEQAARMPESLKQSLATSVGIAGGPGAGPVPVLPQQHMHAQVGAVHRWRCKIAWEWMNPWQQGDGGRVGVQGHRR